MKKIIRLLVAFAFVLTLSVPAYAGMEKLTDGFVQVIKSPMQLIERPKMGMEELDSMPVGFTKGLIESPFYMLKDIGSGLLNMLTFPID